MTVKNTFYNIPECPEGTFSSGVGNVPCETCPANSEGTGTGLTLCPCLQHYYRAPYEEPSTLCTREYKWSVYRAFYNVGDVWV